MAVTVDNLRPVTSEMSLSVDMGWRTSSYRTSFSFLEMDLGMRMNISYIDKKFMSFYDVYYENKKMFCLFFR